jgi:hypothetical protein
MRPSSLESKVVANSQGYAQLQLLAGGHFPPQLVEEVHEEDDLVLYLWGFRRRGWQETYEALAFGKLDIKVRIGMLV